ncbi:MAG TPA: sigma factor-like helix-turn-helix DNA-binding protein, partial [Terriglobales bacterium]|nr:sigma factor-like helix-turn-helix DNA-binding protein [Terriglobales bacterium]
MTAGTSSALGCTRLPGTSPLITCAESGQQSAWTHSWRRKTRPCPTSLPALGHLPWIPWRSTRWPNASRRAMSGLPIEYRETVVLRFQEGLGLEEIATLTKLPLGTVKSRL